MSELKRDLKPFLAFISIFSSVLAILHYFIFIVIFRSVENFDLRQIGTLILTIALFSIPVGLFASRSQKTSFRFISWVGFIWMGWFFILFSFSLIEVISALALGHSQSYWVVFTSLPILIYGLFKGLSDPKLVTHKLSNSHIAGLSLVQLSDLHIGLLHLNKEWLSRVVKQVSNLNPDIFVITGDLVENGYQTIQSDLNILKDVKASHKFYITGNHEYLHGGALWEKKLNELGFEVLHNSNKTIQYKNAKILMAGVPDYSIARFSPGKISQPDLALHSSIKTDYKILLAHQPVSVKDIKNEKCDLLLSGHTHGGQIFPFHLLVRLVQPVVAGFKEINGTLVFAHQGTGFWGPPIRWFSRNEIVLFKWQ